MPRKSWEATLAWVGVVLWGLWTGVLIWGAAFDAVGIFFPAVGVGLTALAIIDTRRWQRGQPALPISSRSRARADKPSVPSTAWFALGAIPVWIVSVAVLGRTPEGVRTYAWIFSLVSIVAGEIASRGLTFLADRRVDRAYADLPPAPPSGPRPY
jgi:hypothetical protein